MLERRQSLIGNEFQILPFAQLPESHQLAIAWYMAVDGKAWGGPDLYRSTPDVMEQLRANLPLYVEQNGNELFGVTTITAQQAKEVVMTDHDSFGGKTLVDEHGTFEKYHQWFLEQEPVPLHDTENRWPLIVAGDGYLEAFEDGYVRLHSYLRSGHADIPMIFFPDSCHLSAEQRLAMDANLARIFC